MIYVLVPLVSILFWAVVVAFIRYTPVTRKLPQRKPECPYCHGELLVLTYYTDFVDGNKCSRHKDQWDHIVSMENQFFGPPLKVRAVTPNDHYYDFDSSDYFPLRKYRKNLDVVGTYLLMDFDKLKSFERTCYFLKGRGYAVNLRYIQGVAYYEILDSFGQFSEIGVFDDPTLGFNIPVRSRRTSVPDHVYDMLTGQEIPLDKIKARPLSEVEEV